MHHVAKTAEQGRRTGTAGPDQAVADEHLIREAEKIAVAQNYPNQFPDGRPAKSTSIGIKNAAGEYIAALCLNLAVSVLSPVTLVLSNLVATDTEHRDRPLESLRDRNARELRQTVEALAAERASTPRSLSRKDKRELVQQLHRDGFFDSRDAAQTIADLLGVSRATVYNYTK